MSDGDADFAPPTGRDRWPTTRLHHDVEVAQRATLALSVGLVLAAFVLLAVGATVYDVGNWLRSGERARRA